MAALASTFLHIWIRYYDTSAKSIVLCEGPNLPFRAHNDPKYTSTQPLITPRRLPEKLSPPPIEKLQSKAEYSKSVTFTKATPRPSNWPHDCALHQRNSNAPIEDRGVITLLDIKRHFADEESSPNVSTKWLMAVVIDGHSGWQTAEYVSRVLPSRIQKSINELEPTLTAEHLSKGLCHCFEKLDDEIRKFIEPAFNLGHASVAKAGATTCAVFVTPTKIITANVGDSRAFLSRSGRSIALSTPHNAGEPSEALKLREAHPNEDDIIHVSTPKSDRKKDGREGSGGKGNAGGKTESAAKATCGGKETSDSKGGKESSESKGGKDASGTKGEKDPAEGGDATKESSGDRQSASGWDLLGWMNPVIAFATNLCDKARQKKKPGSPACYTKGRLQLTRAFGDFYLKDAKFAADWDSGRLLVNLPHSFPYVLRQPEVAVLSREPSADEFVIIASDGVWDELEPDEAAGIVRNKLLRDGGTVSEAAKAVEEAVLAKAASKAKMTKEALLELTPKERRQHLDDMTIAIVNLALRTPLESSSL